MMDLNLIDPKVKEEIIRDAVENCNEEDLRRMLLSLLLGKEVIKPMTEKDLTIKVSSILTEMGMPTNLNGYALTREAIIYCFNNKMASATKELYPHIAKKMDTTPSRVERSIRHAIVSTFEKGNSDACSKYFGKKYEMQGRKPTNSEFVYGLADWLTLNS